MDKGAAPKFEIFLEFYKREPSPMRNEYLDKQVSI